MSLLRFAIHLLIIVFSVYSASTLAQVSQTQLGAAQTNKYLPLLENKSVGLVVNQTAKIGDIHLVDLLITNGINVRMVFAPEHGFRGDKGAGETIENGLDPAPSCQSFRYMANKKPTQQCLHRHTRL